MPVSLPGYTHKLSNEITLERLENWAKSNADLFKTFSSFLLTTPNARTLQKYKRIEGESGEKPSGFKILPVIAPSCVEFAHLEYKILYYQQTLGSSCCIYFSSVQVKRLFALGVEILLNTMV